MRLNITVEGHTEELFVKRSVIPYLLNYKVIGHVRKVLTSRSKNKRGGMTTYFKAKGDIEQWLKEDHDPDTRFTTMFDLFRLPGDFPKIKEAKEINDKNAKVKFIEHAFQEDIDDHRFIPYIQLHEFEALVFANIRNLGLEYFEREEQIALLEKVVEEHHGNPELINDDPETAPSKRIIKLIPEYDKVNVGAQIAEINGVEFLKTKCPHFSEWMDILEKLSL